MATNNVSLLRRLGAICYDGALSFSWLFFLALIYSLLFGQENIEPNAPYFWLYQLFLLLSLIVYFCFSWYRGGQTLGMKSWRIRLVNQDNSALSFGKSLLYFFLSIFSWVFFAAGFIYILFNKERQALHNKISKTHLIYLAKDASQAK